MNANANHYGCRDHTVPVFGCKLCIKRRGPLEERIENLEDARHALAARDERIRGLEREASALQYAAEDTQDKLDDEEARTDAYANVAQKLVDFVRVRESTFSDDEKLVFKDIMIAFERAEAM